MKFRKLLQSQPSTSSINLPPQTPLHHHHHHLHHHVLTPLLAATATVFLLSLLSFLCHRRRTKKRTAPFAFDNPPHRFSYSLLRRATHSFFTPLGHGGFGTVYSGTLPSPSPSSPSSNAVKSIAVKLMDSSSHQGEREFHNELFFSSKLRSIHVIAPIGFSSDPKRRRFLLVYPLMQNGNLQDALLRRKCPELFDWKKRFEISLDIAKGLCYLHSCDPVVIHGDIKPSNILLDCDFSAKIGDFGLARLKSEPLKVEVEVLVGNNSDDEKRNGEEFECDGISGVIVVDDCGSLESQSVSVNTGFLEEGFRVEQSPVSPGAVEMGVMRMVERSPESVKSEKDVVVGVGGVKRNGKGLKSNSVKDLWWKQDNEDAGLGTGSGSVPVVEGKKVRDYVMEWIGRDVKSEIPKSGELEGRKMGKPKKEKKKKLEWWESMDEENVSGVMRNEKRTVREWWNEDYCEEIARKKKNKKKNKKKKGVESDNDGKGDYWWVSDDELHGDRKKNKRDWWLDGFSGELWRARRNSFDSASGEIPKSGGVSSTPSMRGTVCYVAPEYGYGGDVSEKCDVYSFGILLLVIISGRRPLQVTGSPLSEFQRANLLSWVRHCARNGKLIELVDDSIQSLDKDQALLCIKVALVCLLKSPARRPSMKEVVGMLSGDLEPPQLPVEYSPSTPSRFPFKSRRKGK